MTAATHGRMGVRGAANAAGTANGPAATDARARAIPQRRWMLLAWVFFLIPLLGAVDVLVSGRNLAEMFYALMATSETARTPLAAWIQRGVSLLLLLACAQQVVHVLSKRRPLPSPTLLAAFLLYWVATVAVPAVMGAHPMVSHELVYTMSLGVAVCLLSQGEMGQVVRATRNGLLVVMLGGLAMIAIRPAMVLDLSYSQGLLPGLPRFGGLTPHAVTQGLAAMVFLVLLWVHPYHRRWANLLAWAVGLGVLFLAQSKTAWLAFVMCAVLLWFVRRGMGTFQRIGDPRADNGFGVALLVGAMLVVAVLAASVLFGDLFGRIADFLNSREGAQIASLTGRDRIWIVAWEEWQNHPVFGYGLTLWDAAYRASIDIPNATHAHNQFLDDLARAGLVGATGLVIYAAVLVVMALRTARASGGLSLALCAVLLLGSISEVPLSLLGYGTVQLPHLMLLAAIAGACRRETARASTVPMNFGVASS